MKHKKSVRKLLIDSISSAPLDTIKSVSTPTETSLSEDDAECNVDDI